MCLDDHSHERTGYVHVGGLKVLKVRSGPTVVAFGALVAFAMATMAAWAAAWYRNDLLGTFPNGRLPGDNGRLSKADMLFDNTMGVRNALLVAATVGGIVWLYRMRNLAEAVWPQGQRRHRAWILLGWWVPVANFFIPKMIVNDLWAATDPRHQRGTVLLRAWWLSCIVAFPGSGTMFRHLPHATYVSQAMDQMTSAEQGDAAFLVAAVLSLAVVWKLSGRLEPVAGHAPHRQPSVCVQQPTQPTA